jgi:predicted small lipoprotein YifL
MQKTLSSTLAAAALLALTACGGDHLQQPPQAAPVAPPKPVASTIAIDFSKGIDGWVAGVADYKDDNEPTETGAGWHRDL